MKSVVNLYAFGNHKHEHSLGSGVIISSKKGYIVTNAHVVKGYTDIIATLKDKNYYKTKIIGIDSDTDIAVLQINASNLPALQISHQPLNIGENVYAIGNPFGFNHTVTSGIISALGRRINLNKYENFIQIDASINPGNSGGALINQAGKLIGINAAIFTKTGANNGIGFAIPAFMFEPIIQQLIAHGSISRSTLGVYVQEINPKLARALGMSMNGGLVINDVVPNSNAQRIGLEKFDVILAINKHPVNKFIDLQSMVGIIRTDSEFEISLVRNGSIRTIRDKMQAFNKKQNNNLLSGVRVIPTSYWDDEENAVNGLEVVGISESSRAWMGDLRVGDIIININKEPTQRLQDIAKFNSAKTKSLLVQIKRHSHERLILVQ